MKHTIEEHIKLQEKDNNDHWDISRSEWAVYHADLLAEVKRLQETVKSWEIGALIRKLEAERDRYKQAFYRYGQHDDRCLTRRAPDNECYCGFKKALRGEE